MNWETNSGPYGYGGVTAETIVRPVRITISPASSSTPRVGSNARSTVVLITLSAPDPAAAASSRVARAQAYATVWRTACRHRKKGICNGYPACALGMLESGEWTEGHRCGRARDREPGCGLWRYRAERRGAAWALSRVRDQLVSGSPAPGRADQLHGARQERRQTRDSQCCRHRPEPAGTAAPPRPSAR